MIFFVNYQKRDYENLENKKYVIAITGNIGSGKTTVAEILRNFGYSVLDVDIFSKEIIYNERSVKIFLSYLIDKKIGKKLDYKEIGFFFEKNPDLEIIFENWYQIFLGIKLKEKINNLKNEQIYFFDIPLLQKKRIENLFDDIWIIESDLDKCYQRVKTRNNYSDDKIKRLIKESMMEKNNIKNNHLIIKNNGSIKELKKIIKQKLKKYEIIVKNL